MDLFVDARIFGMMGLGVFTLRGQVGIGSAHSHGSQCIRAAGTVERKIVAAAILAAPAVRDPASSRVV
jgi:hypothetical protein